MPGRPAVTGARAASRFPSNDAPSLGCVIRAHYLPEPGKALNFQCLQSKRDTALKPAKGIGDSFQKLTNRVPMCQRGNPWEPVTKAGWAKLALGTGYSSWTGLVPVASPGNHQVIRFADALVPNPVRPGACRFVEVAILMAMPLAEKSLIEDIRRSARAAGSSVRIGIGDDCAVIRRPRGHEILVTTDFTLENIHFRRAWHTPEVVGRRCLTRGLSDLAAMGGRPLAAFLSLALPADLPRRWVDRFMRGLLTLAHEHNVPLAGGDTAQSPKHILADIVVAGSAPNRTAIVRS